MIRRGTRVRLVEDAGSVGMVREKVYTEGAPDMGRWFALVVMDGDGRELALWPSQIERV